MSELRQTLQSVYALYKSGESLKAETGIRQALTKWPNEADVLRLGALTALALNQVVTAHQRIDAAIARAPMTAEMANIQGRVLKASGDWAAAEDAYLLALKIDPNFERARTNLLNLFTITEQPNRVLETLQDIDDIGPIEMIARAEALTGLGQYDEALAALTGVKDSAFQERVLFQRMKCLEALGRLDEMRETFSEISVQSSLYPRAMTIFANSFEMRDQRDMALGQLEASMASPVPSVSLQAIRLLKNMNCSERAQTAIEDLLKNYPKNVHVLCETADTARLAGNADESCEIYKRALTLSPGHYEGLTGFAQAAIAAGRLNEAQTVLQAALNQAPNNQFLLALVATLLRETGSVYTHLYDYKNFVRVYDLVPPKGYKTIEEFNAALKEKLDTLHVYKNAPVNQSLRIGTQTEQDLSLIDDPVFADFFEAIDAPVRDYMNAIGHDPAHPLKRRNRGRYRVQGAWSVRLQSQGHHINHVHPMGWLSSAYYVDLPKVVSDGEDRQGWIKFGEPNLDVGQTAEHFEQPKPGRLVLFPSYMWHGTVPFTGPDTRLTLPFDIVPA